MTPSEDAAFRRAEKAGRTLAAPRGWTFDHLSVEGTYHPGPGYHWTAYAIFARPGSRVRRKIVRRGSSVADACMKLAVLMETGFPGWAVGY